MFGFIKKIFGFDKETLKDAGVQIEQKAPYKVEALTAQSPVAVSVDPNVNTVVSTTPTEQVVIREVPATTVTAPKKTAPKKTAPKQATASKPRGRRPKTKPASK